MRSLLVLFCLPVAAQSIDYGQTAQPGALYDFTAAARTMPIKTGLSSATPGTCTPSKELYVKTDATPGQQLFICNAAGDGFVLVGDGGSGYSLPISSASVLGGVKIGSGLTIDVSGVVNATGGGGGGTINSGSGNGIWFPFGFPSYSSGDMNINNATASKAYRHQIIVPAQMEFRAIHFEITAVAGSGKAFQVGIYNAAMTSLVAYTTVATSGGSTDINTLGFGRFMFGGGSAVSGGVLTLPAGTYWVVPCTDSPSMKIRTYGDSGNAAGMKIANANTTVYGNPIGALVSSLSGTTIATGSNTSFALTGNIGSVTWSPINNQGVPIFCLVN